MLDKNGKEMQVGDKIKHVSYGNGVVITINNDEGYYNAEFNGVLRANLFYKDYVEIIESNKGANMQNESTKQTQDKSHPYKEVLIALANGEQVQVIDHSESESWQDCHPQRALAFIYSGYTLRVKPKVILINGYEVPEPMREKLENCADYYTACPDSATFYSQLSWTNHNTDYRWLDRGLIHLTKEAAILHAKALLSFTHADVK